MFVFKVYERQVERLKRRTNWFLKANENDDNENLNEGLCMPFEIYFIFSKYIWNEYFNSSFLKQILINLHSKEKEQRIARCYVIEL